MPTKHPWLRKTLKEIARTLNNMADATTPYNLQDWLLRTPVVPVRRRDTYIELPAFAYTGLEWKGASEVISQFNFSASRKFTLGNLPTKPTDVNYGLCIRYRIGDTIHRFKLWDDDAFKLTGDVPVYSNQIIRANFVLEVWSYEDETVATNVAAIQMITSVRILPTDVSQLGVSAALAVGAEFRELGNTAVPVAALPTTNLVAHYDPTSVTLISSKVSNWANLVAGWPALTQSNAAYRPLSGPDGLVDAALDSIQFNGLNTYLSTAVIDVNGPFTVYMYCATLTDLFPRTLIEFGGASLVGILNYESSGAIRFSRGGVPNVEASFPAEVAQEPGNCKIVKMILEASQLSLQVENNALQTVAVSGSLANLQYVVVGNDNLGSGGYSSYSLYELIVYNTEAVSAEDDLAVKNYLANKYLTNPFVLPLTFNTGVAWLDNAD
jgi:hypothetical protein